MNLRNKIIHVTKIRGLPVQENSYFSGFILFYFFLFFSLIYLVVLAKRIQRYMATG